MLEKSAAADSYRLTDYILLITYYFLFICKFQSLLLEYYNFFQGGAWLIAFNFKKKKQLKKPEYISKV